MSLEQQEEFGFVGGSYVYEQTVLESGSIAENVSTILEELDTEGV